MRAGPNSAAAAAPSWPGTPPPPMARPRRLLRSRCPPGRSRTSPPRPRPRTNHRRRRTAIRPFSRPRRRGCPRWRLRCPRRRRWRRPTCRRQLRPGRRRDRRPPGAPGTSPRRGRHRPPRRPRPRWRRPHRRPHPFRRLRRSRSQIRSRCRSGARVAGSPTSRTGDFAESVVSGSSDPGCTTRGRAGRPRRRSDCHGGGASSGPLRTPGGPPGPRTGKASRCGIGRSGGCWPWSASARSSAVCR